MNLSSLTNYSISKSSRSLMSKVFIVGSGRCGSHWLLDLLLHHPMTFGERKTESKVFRIFEPYLRTSLDHSFSRKIKNLIRYPLGNRESIFWHEIIQAYDQYAPNMSMKRFVTKTELIKIIDEIRNIKLPLERKLQLAIDRIYETYIIKYQTNTSNVFVEKTPGHLSAVDLILEGFPESKVIEMVRDGRDVCKSHQALSHEGVEWVSDSRKEQIKMWKRAIEKGKSFRSNPEYAQRILLVRYEDLKGDLSHELKRIFNFVEVTDEDSIIDEIVKHSSLINESKMGSSMSWKEVFSEEELDFFYKETSVILTELNYPIEYPNS